MSCSENLFVQVLIVKLEELICNNVEIIIKSLFYGYETAKANSNPQCSYVGNPGLKALLTVTAHFTWS